MLEAIRKHAHGWLAKVILGLIAVTFALFGIESYMSGDRSGGIVAEVGKVGISRDEFTREIQGQTDRMRDALGPAFDPTVAETADFRSKVLDSLIERKVLLQGAQALGILTPDAYVASVLTQIPSFQEDGKFSQQRYEAVLRQNGRTPAAFENELRQSFMLDIMSSPVVHASFTSATSMDQLARWVAQQREVSWADLPATMVAAQVKVETAEIEREYKAKQAEFTDPEQIRVEYVELDAAAVAARIEVSEQAVAEFYAANPARFGLPEQRSASHILIAVDQAADPAARAKAKAKAVELLATVQKSPARFGELARTESQDPGSAAQDGSLGSFGRGMMVKPFEDAVFAMKPNEIRGLVESDFGYHIIRLDGIQPAQTAPLQEARGAIVQELRKQQAQKQFADLAENFGNLVYENADSLQPAATAVGVNVRQSDWMSAKVAPPPFDYAALADALFSPESVRSRQNTEAFEVRPGVLVAARVIEHRPARLRPLSEVAATIEARLRTEQSARLLAEAGASRLKGLKGGEEGGLTWSGFKVLGRQPTPELDEAGIRAVFRVDTGTLPAYTGYTRADGTYRILRVSRVVDASALAPELRASIESGVLQAQQRADMQALIGLVKAGYKVKVHPNAIEGR